MLQSAIVFFILVCSNFCFAQDEQMIKLPSPRVVSPISLEETIAKRRSIRSFSNQKLTLEQISQLLWAVQGITDEKKGLRSAPSAGAVYPLEIYLINSDGLFYYRPQTHMLQKINNMDLREGLSNACLGQQFVKNVAIDIVICANFARTTSHYGNKGENYVYIEVGHAAQNLHLQAVGLGLGSVPVGAFVEEDIQSILGVPKNIIPVYVIPVGYILKEK
jgi:SagB-type dehydrogenase family enzyme